MQTQTQQTPQAEPSYITSRAATQAHQIIFVTRAYNNLNAVVEALARFRNFGAYLDDPTRPPLHRIWAYLIDTNERVLRFREIEDADWDYPWGVPVFDALSESGFRKLLEVLEVPHAEPQLPTQAAAEATEYVPVVPGAFRDLRAVLEYQALFCRKLEQESQHVDDKLACGVSAIVWQRAANVLGAVIKETDAGTPAPGLTGTVADL